MLVILLPLLVCILGLVVYLGTDKAKAQEIGRICFAFGLLATLLVFGTGHGLILR